MQQSTPKKETRQKLEHNPENTYSGMDSNSTPHVPACQLSRFSHSLDAGWLVDDERHNAEAAATALHLCHGGLSLGRRRRCRKIESSRH